MNRAILEARLCALGYITQEQMAEALFNDTDRQSTVSRYLSGARPVPRWCDRTLELLEKDPPVILSGSMRLALEGAAVGDHVPEPRSDEPHVKRVDWPTVYGAMKIMGAIEYDQDGRPVLTQAGHDALNRARRTGTRPGEPRP